MPRHLRGHSPPADEAVLVNCRRWREDDFKAEFCRLLAQRAGWSLRDCESAYGPPGHRFGQEPADAVEDYLEASIGDMDRDEQGP